MNLIIQEELPFTTIESAAFRDFIELCNPSVLPMMVKSTSISEAIMSRFRSAQVKLKDLLASQPYISLTCDCWTSTNGRSIFGITAHWINKDFKTCEAIIAMKQIIGHHTGTNLAAHLLEVLNQYNITDRVFCITADNASNNHTMALQLQRLIPQFFADEHLLGCLAHVINLSARAGLNVFSKHLGPHASSVPVSLTGLVEEPEVEDLSSTLSKIDALTKLVKKSPERARDWSVMASTTRGIMKPLTLITDVATRWNSKYYQLERFVLLKPVVKFKCDEDRQLHKYRLSDAEWDVIEHMIAFLKPFDVATKRVSSSSYPTFSEAMPTYEWLMDRLDLVC